MGSQFQTVADAVVWDLEDLQSGGWGHATFTVERAWLHEFDHKTAPAFKAKVAAFTLTVEEIARGWDQRDMEVIITFHQRLTALDNDTIDPLAAAVEASLEYFLDGHTLSEATEWHVESAELGGGVNKVIDEATLAKENVFWAEIQLLIRRQLATGTTAANLED